MNFAPTLPPVPVVDPAIASATAALEKHGKTFHFAGRLLPPSRLADGARLYRFLRYMDDLVDYAPDRAEARTQLQRVEEDLAAGRTEDPVVADFLVLRKRLALPAEPVEAFLKGLREDLATVRLDDEWALKRYCYRVAGTVGLLMSTLLGATDRRAVPHAIDLGIAMQLTNIARDVEEDARLGRQYIPATWLRTSGCEEIARADEGIRPHLRDATKRLLREAERYYRSGEAGLAFLPFRPRLAIFVAARLYRAIGKKIEAQGWVTWKGRTVISRRGKVRLTLFTLAAFAGRGGLWRKPKSHDSSLHTGLEGLPGVLPAGGGSNREGD